MKIFSHDPTKPLTNEELTAIKSTEWLVTNGLGGYASGTIAGALTRGFHGYLIAGLPSPPGRTMMLNSILEQVRAGDSEPVNLNGLEAENGAGRAPAFQLAGFHLDAGLPVWTYEVGGLTIEKRVCLPHRQNTAYINYRVSGGSGRIKLRLRPLVNMRDHEAPVNSPLDSYTFTVRDHHYEIRPSKHIPHLRLKLFGHEGAFTIHTKTLRDIVYRRERNRGYSWRGDLWSPGYFSAELSPDSDATLVISTENWAVMSALSPRQAWELEQERQQRLLREAHPDVCNPVCKKLVWAADQFVFTPAGRQEDTARARAAGDEVRSVIAG
ncbi:MAG: glycogen debranching enzyme N-terminal domain-containing protein, partial [Bryobacteraceae bacterium]